MLYRLDFRRERPCLVFTSSLDSSELPPEPLDEGDASSLCACFRPRVLRFAFAGASFRLRRRKRAATMMPIKMMRPIPSKRFVPEVAKICGGRGQRRRLSFVLARTVSVPVEVDTSVGASEAAVVPAVALEGPADGSEPVERLEVDEPEVAEEVDWEL